jgi:hypothetical protein
MDLKMKKILIANQKKVIFNYGIQSNDESENISEVAEIARCGSKTLRLVV